MPRRQKKTNEDLMDARLMFLDRQRDTTSTQTPKTRKQEREDFWRALHSRKRR